MSNRKLTLFELHLDDATFSATKNALRSDDGTEDEADDEPVAIDVEDEPTEPDVADADVDEAIEAAEDAEEESGGRGGKLLVFLLVVLLAAVAKKLMGKGGDLDELEGDGEVEVDVEA